MGPALNLLLDSATLIWATSAPPLLSASARTALEDDVNDIFVSAASAWEIATKHRLGRLEHSGMYDVGHADPFDRVIAAQAELEHMVIVTADRAFDLFPVTRLW